MYGLHVNSFECALVKSIEWYDIRMESFNFDPNSLLESANPNTILSDAIAPLITLFTIFTVVTITVSIAVIVLWIMGMVRTHKVQNAVFDMQKVLHEMNERDKTARSKDSETV